jgi:hypothetical protein
VAVWQCGCVVFLLFLQAFLVNILCIPLCPLILNKLFPFFHIEIAVFSMSKFPKFPIFRLKSIKFVANLYFFHKISHQMNAKCLFIFFPNSDKKSHFSLKISFFFSNCHTTVTIAIIATVTMDTATTATAILSPCHYCHCHFRHCHYCHCHTVTTVTTATLLPLLPHYCHYCHCHHCHCHPDRPVLVRRPYRDWQPPPCHRDQLWQWHWRWQWQWQWQCGICAGAGHEWQWQWHRGGGDQGVAGGGGGAGGEFRCQVPGVGVAGIMHYCHCC